MFFGNPQGLDASRIQEKKGLTCQFSEALTTETSNQSNQSSFLVSAFLMVIILDADASGFSGFPQHYWRSSRSSKAWHGIEDVEFNQPSNWDSTSKSSSDLRPCATWELFSTLVAKHFLLVKSLLLWDGSGGVHDCRPIPNLGFISKSNIRQCMAKFSCGKWCSKRLSFTPIPIAPMTPRALAKDRLRHVRRSQPGSRLWARPADRADIWL